MNTLELVKNAGVVGAGGAGFPTHAKIGAKVDVVLANGAECEPLLHSDQLIMLDRPEDIVDGLKTVMSVTGAGKGIICIKEKNAKVIASFEKLVPKNIGILKMGDFYPAGDEHVLTNEATGRIIPEAGIPIDVGVVVQNVATLANISRAVKGEPVTDKAVTVGGEIAKPGVHVVPVGTPISHLLEKCGGPVIQNYVVLLNGPMMGKLIDARAEVVTKTTSGIFILPEHNPLSMRFLRPLSADIRLSRGACEQCRYCTDFCPRYLQGHSLNPHMVIRVINEQRDPEPDTVTDSFLCCECGVCDLFACPMFLSPRRFYREFKRDLAKRGIKFNKTKTEFTSDIHREFRRVPKQKLVRRLGLAQYDLKPEFHEERWAPDAVEIPLSMHLGAPAEPAVGVGDKVKRGEIIARIPAGKLGANIHASIAGKVTGVAGRIRIEK